MVQDVSLPAKATPDHRLCDSAVIVRPPTSVAPPELNVQSESATRKTVGQITIGMPPGLSVAQKPGRMVAERPDPRQCRLKGKIPLCTKIHPLVAVLAVIAP